MRARRDRESSRPPARGSRLLPLSSCALLSGARSCSIPSVTSPPSGECQALEWRRDGTARILPGMSLVDLHRFRFRLAVLAVAATPGVSTRMWAQQPARADTVSLRADYRDLGELLQHLPAVAVPELDQSRAIWLGSLPLSCLDRLQPRPGGRGGAAVRPNTPTDSTVRPPQDSANRATSAPPAASARGGPNAGLNNGAGYFWVPTYRLVPDHDRLRAF